MGDEIACCNDVQQSFLYLYVIYLVIVLVISDTLVAKPGRLLATAIHEMSHALACWLTGGQVLKLEVYENEGGVTKYRGGWRCLIAPAGYLGEAFWGMMACIASGGRRTATAAAITLMVALLATLCYSPNRVLIILCIFYEILAAVLIYIEWKVYNPVLPYVTLFVGVFLGVCACQDITRHLILRSHPGSDAYSLYEESGRCCPPRCIGCWWLFWAIVMQLAGIWIALILSSDECRDQGFWQCMIRSRLDLSLKDFHGWWK